MPVQGTWRYTQQLISLVVVLQGVMCSHYLISRICGLSSWTKKYFQHDTGDFFVPLHFSGALDLFRTRYLLVSCPGWKQLLLRRRLRPYITSRKSKPKHISYSSCMCRCVGYQFARNLSLSPFGVCVHLRFWNHYLKICSAHIGTSLPGRDRERSPCTAWYLYFAMIHILSIS